jgi:hypothetical protein
MVRRQQRHSRAQVSMQPPETLIVMPGLVPGIHVFFPRHTARKTWMAGTSPAMTRYMLRRLYSPLRCC